MYWIMTVGKNNKIDNRISLIFFFIGKYIPQHFPICNMYMDCVAVFDFCLVMVHLLWEWLESLFKSAINSVI